MAWIACDVDGTITSAPSEFETLLMALKAAGHRVTILTGTKNPATQDEFDRKVQFLCALGLPECWDDMVIFCSEGKQLSKDKAAWLSAHSVNVFIDNDERNATSAAPYVPLVLVPWTTRK